MRQDWQGRGLWDIAVPTGPQGPLMSRLVSAAIYHGIFHWVVLMAQLQGTHKTPCSRLSSRSGEMKTGKEQTRRGGVGVGVEENIPAGLRRGDAYFLEQP